MQQSRGWVHYAMHKFVAAAPSLPTRAPRPAARARPAYGPFRIDDPVGSRPAPQAGAPHSALSPPARHGPQHGQDRPRARPPGPGEVPAGLWHVNSPHRHRIARRALAGGGYPPCFGALWAPRRLRPQRRRPAPLRAPPRSYLLIEAAGRLAGVALAATPCSAMPNALAAILRSGPRRWSDRSFAARRTCVGFNRISATPLSAGRSLPFLLPGRTIVIVSGHRKPIQKTGTARRGGA